MSQNHSFPSPGVHRHRSLYYLPALCLATVVCLAGAFAAKPVSASTAANDDDGKQAFVDLKCARCHSVESEGLEATAPEKMRGPVIDRSEERDAAWLEGYLKKEKDLNGKQHKPSWKGSDKEMQALLDWLNASESSPE